MPARELPDAEPRVIYHAHSHRARSHVARSLLRPGENPRSDPGKPAAEVRLRPTKGRPRRSFEGLPQARARRPAARR